MNARKNFLPSYKILLTNDVDMSSKEDFRDFRRQIYFKFCAAGYNCRRN